MRPAVLNSADSEPEVCRNTTMFPPEGSNAPWINESNGCTCTLTDGHLYSGRLTQTGAGGELTLLICRRAQSWSPPASDATFLFWKSLLASIFQFVRPHWDQDRGCMHTHMYTVCALLTGCVWRSGTRGAVSAHCRQNHAAFMMDGWISGLFSLLSRLLVHSGVRHNTSARRQFYIKYECVCKPVAEKIRAFITFMHHRKTSHLVEVLLIIQFFFFFFLKAPRWMWLYRGTFNGKGLGSAFLPRETDRKEGDSEVDESRNQSVGGAMYSTKFRSLDHRMPHVRAQIHRKKTALEHTRKRTADSQLACTFYAIFRGNTFCTTTQKQILFFQKGRLEDSGLWIHIRRESYSVAFCLCGGKQLQQDGGDHSHSKFR